MVFRCISYTYSLYKQYKKGQNENIKSALSITLLFKLLNLVYKSVHALQ